jgi:putative protease
VTVLRIVNEDGGEQESAPHAKQRLWIDLGEKLDMYDILRMKA